MRAWTCWSRDSTRAVEGAAEEDEEDGTDEAERCEMSPSENCVPSGEEESEGERGRAKSQPDSDSDSDSDDEDGDGDRGRGLTCTGESR